LVGGAAKSFAHNLPGAVIRHMRIRFAIGRIDPLRQRKADRVCATPVLAAGEEWDVWHTQRSELAKLQVSVTGDVRSKKGPMRFCPQPTVTAVAEDYVWTNPLTRSIFRRNSKTRQRWFDDCLANVLQTGTLIFAVWRLGPFRSACRVPSPLTHCVNLTRSCGKPSKCQWKWRSRRRRTKSEGLKKLRLSCKLSDTMMTRFKAPPINCGRP